MDNSEKTNSSAETLNRNTAEGTAAANASAVDMAAGDFGAFDQGTILEDRAARDKKIVRTSVIGILANVSLAAFKAIVGLLVHSIAITLDAVNNLSDAGSSIATIIGTRLAARPADREHPFGHGRTEYLSAMVIAILVLYAGITSFTKSVKKIINPEIPSYTAPALIIVAAAVLVKIFLGRYVTKVGKEVSSDSLKNSGKDALMDAVISFSTLAAAVIYLTTSVSLEAWLGVVIALVIVKAGIDMLRDTLSRILGERADASLAREIRETVLSFPEVHGVYDLVLHNYGPDIYNGSLHIEVKETMDAGQIDELERQITVAVYLKNHVLLTAIGIYSMNTKNDHAAQVEKEIRDYVESDPYVLQMHGFYLNEKEKRMRFDVIISFDAPDRQAVYRQTVQHVQERFPDYKLEIVMDTDFCES
ncbi:MAG: cation diffusion facilitator family transporter [Lachnospiraceae bacterium]|jgi:cation diffusion facilitator family transporter